MLMVYIAEEQKLSNWSYYFIMDGNRTVRAATYKIMFICDYVTEHAQNIISLPPKEPLILNRTLIKTNLLYVRFWGEIPQWARASSFTRVLNHT